MKLFLYCRLTFFTKNFELLFNTVLVQYGISVYGVGLWIVFNKGVDIIDDVDKVIRKKIEGKRTNNQVDPAHGPPIVYTEIVVDGGSIP